MKFPFAVIAVLLMGLSSANAADPLTEEAPAKTFRLPAHDRKHVLMDAFAVSRSVHAIPLSVRQTFMAVSQELSFQMVEPGQEFQETDDGRNRNLPRRRLIFVARTNAYCVVGYEDGGFALEYQIAFFRLVSGHARLKWVADITRFSSLQDVRKAVEKNTVFEVDRKDL